MSNEDTVKIVSEKHSADDCDIDVLPTPKKKMGVIKAEPVYKIYQLKSNVFEKKTDGGCVVKCWCGVPCKLHRNSYVCGNRGSKNAKSCGVSFAGSAVKFIDEHELLHNFENSKMRYIDCPDCGECKLIVPTSENFGSYGQPAWMCSCEKGKKLYVTVLETYRGNRELADEMWNMDVIDALSASRQKGKKQSATQQKADWKAMMADNAEEV